MNITSVNNDKVKLWTSLSLKKNRDNEGIFVIEGNHLVSIALEKGLVVDLIVLEDSYEFENKYIVTKEVMKKISMQQSIPSVIATVKKLEEKIDDGNILILDRLQDPGNLGTIIRSAVAFGFKNIFLGDGTVDIYNDKVIRSSEGMIFNINFKKGNIIKYLDTLKDKGYMVVGTSVDGGASIKSYKKGDIALIIGNEGSGMDKNIICDEYVNINMSNNCESLNAAVAASILMYEVYND